MDQDQYLYISAGLDDAPIETTDYTYGEGDRGGRVVQIRIGAVRLMCGGTDELRRIFALNALIDAAVKLRSASVARFEAAGGVLTDAPSDTPLGIQDDVAGEVVAS